jgi:nicotinate-nucleotide pyrophosphorylase (carboxylating)
MKYTELFEVEDLVVGCGLDLNALAQIVADALEEDLGGRGVLPANSAGVDVTSIATVPVEAMASAQLVARAAGTLAGLPVAAYTVARLCGTDWPFEMEVRGSDGDHIVPGAILMDVTGNAQALLRAERVALNLITLMSGVATATSAWVQALAGTRTQVRDTRKTVPGLRMLQKYAVRVAGGVNHRMSLSDGALIKDNHVIAVGGVVQAFEAVRSAYPDIPVQVEVTSIQQAHAVVSAGATDILLDNMTIEEMTAIVAELGGAARFEASGGLTLARAASVARTGVNYVAVGAITHSAPALDIALDFVTKAPNVG